MFQFSMDTYECAEKYLKTYIKHIKLAIKITNRGIGTTQSSQVWVTVMFTTCYCAYCICLLQFGWLVNESPGLSCMCCYWFGYLPYTPTLLLHIINIQTQAFAVATSCQRVYSQGIQPDLHLLIIGGKKSPI